MSDAVATSAREEINLDEAAGLTGTASLTPFHSGAPAAVGVPLFVAGSIALGLLEINFIPTADVGGPMAVTLFATGLFTLITAIWCIALGQTIVGSIFAIFSGFWISFSALVFGLLHNWYGLAPATGATPAVVAADGSAVTHVVEAYLITWLAIFVLLTVTTLRLPAAFSAIFILVVIALAAVLIGTIQTSQGWHTLGGIVAFGFAGIGMLVYADTMSQAFGGKPIPLGKPLQN